MPLGQYDNFDSCVQGQRQRGHSEDSARKICGKIQQNVEGSAVVKDAEIRASSPIVDEVKKLLVRANPAAARGALVSAKELRKSTNLPKSVLDNLMIQAMRTGKVVGHKHDYVSSLSDADRNILVNDPKAEDYGHSGTKFKGAYYVGFAIRQ